MGHLVNPIALRMGWCSNWMDIFFVDQKYYPQYLHMVFRMRLLLPLVFHHHWFEIKASFFCSHFEFTKDYNGLLLRVYFYDGRTETFFHEIEDYVREDYLTYEKGITPLTWNERKSKAFFTFYVFFVFFRLFHPFYITTQWPRQLLTHKSIEYLAAAFLLFDRRPMLHALSFPSAGSAFGLTSVKLCRSTQYRFFYFYLICRNLALLSDRDHPSQGVCSEELIQLFTFVYCNFIRNNSIFEMLRPYLLFLLNYVASTYKSVHMELVQVEFLVITNENITASFMARYIGLKLRQGFTTWQLLNPLRKELHRLLAISDQELKPQRLPFEFLLRRHSHRSYFSSLFRTLLKKLSSFFHGQSYVFFLKRKCILALDSFLFLHGRISSLPLLARDKILAKYERIRNSQRIASLPKKVIQEIREEKRLRYLQLRKRLSRYFLYYFYFSFFHYNRILLYYQRFINYFFKKASTLLSERVLGESIPLLLFPSIVARLLSNSFENYSSWVPSFGTLHKSSLLHLFLLSFNSKMHLFFSQQSHFYLAKTTLAKNRLLRMANPQNSPQRRVGFRGFKIQCLGRFTRRQRSAKLTWIGKGVPLNSFSATIDYGNFSAVLVNSLINVRIWFHKDQGFEPYYLKLL